MLTLTSSRLNGNRYFVHWDGVMVGSIYKEKGMFYGVLDGKSKKYSGRSLTKMKEEMTRALRRKNVRK